MFDGPVNLLHIMAGSPLAEGGPWWSVKAGGTYLGYVSGTKISAINKARKDWPWAIRRGMILTLVRTAEKKPNGG